jgi:hypothetical protein
MFASATYEMYAKRNIWYVLQNLTLAFENTACETVVWDQTHINFIWSACCQILTKIQMCWQI